MVRFFTSGMLVNLGKCFYRKRKLIFSLNFSLFWRYFGKKFWKLAYFSLKNGKLTIFIKIFNVFKLYFSKKLWEFDHFWPIFQKKFQGITNFLQNLQGFTRFVAKFFLEKAKSLKIWPKFWKPNLSFLT